MPPIWIPTFDKTMELLSSSPKLKAEKKVAEALNKIDSSDVWIFHSLRYEISRSNAAVTDLEIDFLIVWKNRGFLILEVKGGRVEFDPIEKQWWLTPKGYSRQKKERSPVDQVLGQRNDFCKEILPRVFPNKLNLRNIVDRALVFPDVPYSDFKGKDGKKPQRIDDFEVESIVFRDTMDNLVGFVGKKLEPCTLHLNKRDSYVPEKLFGDLVDFLRPAVRVEVSPKHILEEAENHIEVITNKQKDQLNHVIRARWLLMTGPAGSAKTVLGLSAIRTWVEGGENAYYITASKHLVRGLREDSRFSNVKNRIYSIHDF